jgi:riboflavin kinase/FMN adenylyltransferase
LTTKSDKLKLNNNIKSIAIGSFDGLHLAHKKLINQVDGIVIIERNYGYLTPGYKRSLFTNKTCFFYHLDKVKLLNSETFVKKLQEDFPALEKIVVGYDFAFGKDKMGDAKHLQMLFDGEVIIVDEVEHNGISVHSRIIKSYLKDGNIKMANELLGRAYQIEGEVVKGQGLGKKELVATLNLNVKNYQLPLDGVYATRTKVGSSWFVSISFLGHRVTTDNSYAIETHIIEQDIGTLDGSIELEFVEHIRDNKKFNNLAELKKQINSDIDEAKKIVV